MQLTSGEVHSETATPNRLGEDRKLADDLMGSILDGNLGEDDKTTSMNTMTVHGDDETEKPSVFGGRITKAPLDESELLYTLPGLTIGLHGL